MAAMPNLVMGHHPQAAVLRLMLDGITPVSVNKVAPDGTPTPWVSPVLSVTNAAGGVTTYYPESTTNDVAVWRVDAVDGTRFSVADDGVPMAAGPVSYTTMWVGSDEEHLAVITGMGTPGPAGPPPLLVRVGVTMESSDASASGTVYPDTADDGESGYSFDFHLPSAVGEPGPAGEPGPPGDPGAPGPVPSLTVGSVAEGPTAAVTVTGTDPYALNFTIPSKGAKGDTGDRGATGPAGVSSIAPGQYELRGTGSPVGVVSPPGPGIYYTDTAGTNGAWRWVSTSMSSMDWRVVYGDTGRREISSLVSGLSGGHVYVRRVGDWVTVDADDAQFQSLATGNPFIPLGRGFYPSPTYVGAMYALAGSGGPTDQGLSRIDRVSGLRFSDAGRTLWLRDTRTWATTDPWPTALPGTPA